VQQAHYNYQDDMMLGLIETPARFTLNGEVGYGMMEFAFFSELPKYTG
jgi:hypothetical protein